MTSQGSQFLQLGSAIVIMSTSGALGRYIALPPPVIIWVRCFIGAIALFFILKLLGKSFKIGRQSHFWTLFGSAVLLGIHWVSYFYSLQLSSVAIGMLSLFTYPVITALLEPIILKVRLQRSSVIFGVLAFVGVGLLAPEMNIENDYTLGIVIGIFSALCYSVRNILLKKRISDQSGITLMFYQLLFLTLLLWPVLFLFKFQLSQVSSDWEAILFLGLITTATGHTLFVLSFKHFTISTVSVISSLTPLIGTFIGFLVLDEVPSGRTYLGGTLIFLTVIAESIKSVRQKRGTS